MKIPNRGLILLFSLLLLLLAWTVYQPSQKRWQTAATWGNASPEVRAAVTNQLRAFQDAYTNRDPAAVGTFMERLFSRDHPVVLGALPTRIFVGSEEVTEAVRTEWESSSRFRFQTDNAEVSAVGDVAWFATAGSVSFDLARFLVVPLRLSGVMAKEDGIWKLRQVQFQFDLHLGSLLVLQVALLVWAVANLVWFVAGVTRGRVPPTSEPGA